MLTWKGNEWYLDKSCWEFWVIMNEDGVAGEPNKRKLPFIAP